MRVPFIAVSKTFDVGKFIKKDNNFQIFSQLFLHFAKKILYLKSKRYSYNAEFLGRKAEFFWQKDGIASEERQKWIIYFQTAVNV